MTKSLRTEVYLFAMFLCFLTVACTQKKQRFVFKDVDVVVDETDVVFSAIDKLIHWHNEKYLFLSDERLFVLDSENGSVYENPKLASEEFANTLRTEIKKQYSYINFVSDSVYKAKLEEGEKRIKITSVFPINKDTLIALTTVFSPYDYNVLNDTGGIELSVRQLGSAVFLTYLNTRLDAVKHINFTEINKDFTATENPYTANNVPYFYFTGKDFSVAQNRIMLPNLRMKAIEIPVYTVFETGENEVRFVDSSKMRFNVRNNMLTLRQIPKMVVKKELIFMGNTLYDTDTEKNYLLPWTDSLWVEDVMKKDTDYYVLCFKRTRTEVKGNRESAIFLFKFSSIRDENKPFISEKRFIGTYADIRRGCLHPNGYSLLFTDDEENLRFTNTCF